MVRFINRDKKFFLFIVAGGYLIFSLLLPSCRESSNINKGGSVDSAVKIGGESFFLEVTSSSELMQDSCIVILFIKENVSTLDREKLKEEYINKLNGKVRFAILEGDWGNFFEINKDKNEKENVVKEFCEFFRGLKGDKGILVGVWLGKTTLLPFKYNRLIKCMDGIVLVTPYISDIDISDVTDLIVPMLIFGNEGDLNTEVWAENLCKMSKSLCEYRFFVSPEENSESLIVLETAKQLLFDWVSTISNISLN